MIRQEGVYVKSFSLGGQAGSPFPPKQRFPLVAAQLEQFRRELYASVPRRADAFMEVVDALSSNTAGRSVVELSLNPCFRHAYSSVYDAIDYFVKAVANPQQAEDARNLREQQITRLIVPYVPVPRQCGFWLLGIDVTPAPRPFAHTLQDRGFVYQPNCIRGNRPVTIGHQYSALVAFPEKAHRTDPPWVVPLSVRRVGSLESGTVVGARQLEALLADDTLPFGKDLCVTAVDSAYSGVPFLGRVAPHENLVTIARLAGNRTVYRPATQPADGPVPSGHPTWYGTAFRLPSSETWGTPDEQVSTSWTTRRGRSFVVHLKAWHDLLMRGTREVPMHRYPFSLVRAFVVDTEGNPVFQHPLWLTVLGKRRQEVTLVQTWQGYGRRYDLEHFFRFGKQRLLMTASQTPNVEHEESWWQIGQLAYTQLWLARSLAQTLPRPWERSLPQPTTQIATPTTVQRDFGRIIRQLGTPATPPKPRGNSPGRTTGQLQPPRQRQPVVKKTTTKPKKPKIAA